MLLPIQDGPCEGISHLSVPSLALWLRATKFLVRYWKMESFSTIFPVFGTGDELEVSPALLCAQVLETVGMWEHFSSLFDQRGEATCDLLFFGKADLDHLLGFLTGEGATQGGQAKGDAIGILDLARAVKLSQSKERFDLIGAHRQADMVQTKLGGGLELDLQIEGEFTANGS